MSKDIQFIGLDIGRGYGKSYTTYNEKVSKSIIQANYSMAFNEPGNLKTEYDSFYFKSNGEGYIVGEKSTVFGNSNSTDENDKTNIVTEVLLQGLLAKTAFAKNVIIAIGVPNIITDKEKQKIEEYYKGKVYKIEIEEKIKEITIVGCSCFKEADAVGWLDEVVEFLGNEDNYGIVSLGFRTVEKSYYKDGIFIEEKSDSDEGGNITYLQQVKNSLIESYNIDDYELDVTNKPEYRERLVRIYDDAKKNLMQKATKKWIDREKIKIVMTGGLLEKMDVKQEDVANNVYILKDPVMASAMGLYNFLESELTETVNED